ncbi:unnamed protein product [Mesocestoides corti]|uniref:Uncharacterized protein n=1 Tax=Mesocestoides corti TaxID=53468 RepID=A0A0R3U1Z2_MESCO|nr:unnamed protein product [Mesocestoides corti]
MDDRGVSACVLSTDAGARPLTSKRERERECAVLSLQQRHFDLAYREVIERCTMSALRPATVRLVLNNGPPLPMPMQVPPGHLVQQIVDEDGVLTHVILSSISPYPQFKTGTPGLGNAPPNGPLPPANRCPVSGLPRPRFGATGGVNVIISPKTSPGLAVAGPAWPTTTMRTAVGEVVAPADAPPAPSAASTERHGRAKPEKQTVVKTEATDEVSPMETPLSAC